MEQTNTPQAAVRPVVLVSACLGFRACRYNGQSLPDPFIEALKRYVEFRPVCPEAEIGLGIPRDPVRVVSGGSADEVDRLLYQPATGRDVTEAMRRYTRDLLDSLEGVDGFILKNRSPSCGFKDVKVYHSKDPAAGSGRGSGLFGEEVLKRFPDYPIEDEGRLRNFTIREHFLTRLFTLARFREVRRQDGIQPVIDFHTRHKLLLLGYNQAWMREMGQTVASYNRSNLPEVLERYEAQLRQGLARAAQPGSVINLLLHAFGGLSPALEPGERQFFLNSLEEYRDERVPLSVPMHLLEAWALRAGNRYLLEQVFLRPYPRELVEITDSGKGRDR